LHALAHHARAHAQIKMNDGPQGFRDGANPGTSTAWPSAMTVGATWDAALVRAWGVAMGKVRATNVLLPLVLSRLLMEQSV
jgi:beta-glucosidase-like glycosyl hydrolase